MNPAVSTLADLCREAAQTWQDGRVLAVYLYGSAARGNPRPDSDVDVALLDSQEDRISLADEARFMDSLERATRRPVDLRMLRDCSPSHQAHVLDHGVLIWAADSHAVERYRREFFQAYGERLQLPPGAWKDFLVRLADKPGSVR